MCNKNLKTGEKEYKSLVLLLEKRKCLNCGKTHKVSAGAFLEEITKEAKQLIRIDQLHSTMKTICEGVSTEVRILAGKALEITACQDCFITKPKEEGLIFVIPPKTTLKNVHDVEPVKEKTKFEMFSLDKF